MAKLISEFTFKFIQTKAMQNILKDKACIKNSKSLKTPGWQYILMK